MNQIQDKWIGLDEAAEYLGIKPVTLRKWIKEEKEAGGIPKKSGGRTEEGCRRAEGWRSTEGNRLGEGWEVKLHRLSFHSLPGKLSLCPLRKGNSS